MAGSFAEQPGRLQGVYETVIYAHDISSAREFYGTTLGLREAATPEPWLAAFELPDGAVVLIFDAVESAAPHREIPSHGTSGAGHVAFSVGADGLAPWRTRLSDCGVDLEQEIQWPSGAVSLYCRDPAGNSVELVDGQIWL